jgi:hypothetical protein
MRGLVLAFAEYGKRESEQEDQDRNHDREGHPLAHPVSSLLPRRGAILYYLGEPLVPLLCRVMYNVATCSSLVR